MHVPLKALSRSMRRRVTSPQISENEPTEFACSTDVDQSKTDSDTGQISIATAPEDGETEALSSESENPLSDLVVEFESPVFGSPDRRVQFTIGAPTVPNIPEDESANELEVQKEPVKDGRVRRKR